MSLRDELQPGKALIAPGIFDGFSALLAERAGFPLAFMSGSAVSCAQLGRPDVGLITLHDMAVALDKICDRVNMPIMVDVDSGFGNAMNVARTVRTLERAGAAGIQMEDQQATKSVAEVMSRPLVSTAEMVGKIKAAQDAKRNAATLISARSDAIYTEGVSVAIERAHRYVEAGADILFIEGIGDVATLKSVCDEFGGKLPLLYNAECDRCSKPISVDQLNLLGLSIVLYPGVLLRAMAGAGVAALDSLQRQIGNQVEARLPALADILQTRQYVDQFKNATKELKPGPAIG